MPILKMRKVRPKKVVTYPKQCIFWKCIFGNAYFGNPTCPLPLSDLSVDPMDECICSPGKDK